MWQEEQSDLLILCYFKGKNMSLRFVKEYKHHKPAYHYTSTWCMIMVTELTILFEDISFQVPTEM